MRPAVTLVFAFTLVACAKGSSVHTTSANVANQENQVEWPSDVTIKLGSDIYELCRNVSAKFGFESPYTIGEYKAQLAAVARCMNHPGMSDRHVLLVGNDAPTYADGMRRAHLIKTYLVGVGLAPDRIDVSSIGEVAPKNVAVSIINAPLEP